MQPNKRPSIHVVIGYRDLFFQDAPPDHLEKLVKYPTDLLILVLSKINAILFHKGGGSVECDRDIFKLVFNRPNDPLLSPFIKGLEGKQGAIGMFSPQPLVMLMAHLISRFKPVTDYVVTNESDWDNFFRHMFISILATNDFYYDSIDGKNLISLEHIWKLDLRRQAYARKVPDIFGVVPIKTFLFFRFISERYGDNVLAEFAESFGIPSANNFYFTFLLAIASASSEFQSDGQPRHCITEESLQRVIKPFVFDPNNPNKSSFAGESYALINQPFYQSEEGILILDFAFLTHLTDAGLLYHFYQSTSLKEKFGIKNYNQYLGMVGKHFFEEYLALELMKKLFHHRHDKIYSEKDDPNYPDILIMQEQTDVFVIEVKSTRIHGKSLEEADISSFQKFLENSFASEKGYSEKNKGIFQIRKQIQYVKTKFKKLRIYPIIIYTEPSLDVCGVNTFLDDKFQAIIESESTFSYKIHPLTCINLHFFIEFYPALKQDRYFLRDRVMQYHRKRKEKLAKVAINKNPTDYLEGQYSFIRFMELKFPMEDPLTYFQHVAKDFGFKTESDNHNKSQ